MVAFELWYWRRLLRVPWTARRSNQSILKEISPDYLLEGLMLKLMFQYLATWCKEPTHWKRPWCWERLKAGREGDNRGWDGWMASPSQWTWVWASSQSWWWTGSLACCSPWGHKESDMTEQLNCTDHSGSTVFILLFLLATTCIPLGPFLRPRTMRTPLQRDTAFNNTQVISCPTLYLDIAGNFSLWERKPSVIVWCNLG